MLLTRKKKISIDQVLRHLFFKEAPQGNCNVQLWLKSSFCFFSSFYNLEELDIRNSDRRLQMDGQYWKLLYYCGAVRTHVSLQLTHAGLRHSSDVLLSSFMQELLVKTLQHCQASQVQIFTLLFDLIFELGQEEKTEI